MTAKVKLTEIIDALEFTSYEDTVFINRITGEVVHIPHKHLRMAEDEEPYDDLLEWEQNVAKTAYDIIENESNYIAINQYEINEYDVMERFCFTVEDPAKEEALLHAIRGRGAFRRFKDMIYQFGIQDDWYDYRETAYKKIAIDFCERKGLQYLS